MTSTLDMDYKDRECTTDLQDRQMLPQLAAGDMAATNAKYYNNCLANLYPRAAQLDKNSATDTSKSVLRGSAFAELVTNIDNTILSCRNWVLPMIPGLPQHD